jgi:hypothetical protein
VKDEEIKDRWREYFDKLFNGENEEIKDRWCELFYCTFKVPTYLDFLSFKK